MPSFLLFPGHDALKTTIYAQIYLIQPQKAAILGYRVKNIFSDAHFPNYPNSYLANYPPPKSSRFASVVLRTYDFVGIAPEKVNVCYAAAFFFLERVKFLFTQTV